MLNVLSILVGLLSLLIVVGIVLGALSSSNTGRNFCLIVGAIAVVRLMLGGGII